MTLLQDIKDRYNANREWMLGRDMLMGNHPPAEDVTDEGWKSDVDYVTKAMERHTFTWYKYTFDTDGDPESIEDGVTVEKRATTEDPYRLRCAHAIAYEHRPATREEIVHYMLSGEYEDEMQELNPFDC